MINPGGYRERVTVERRNSGTDAYGNVLSDTWATLCQEFAAFRPQYGRESMAAGRLESTMGGTVTLRRSNTTAGILPSDRIVFRDAPLANKVFNIRSIVPTIDDIELVVEEGVAT